MEIKIHCKYDAMLKLNEFNENIKNRNKHPAIQIDRLAKLYKYQGVRHPIIVSSRSGAIVAGHGRLMAARECQMSEFPVVYQNFESDEQEYAFLQSDNAIASWSELDLSAINVDLQDLGPDFDIDFLGLEGFELDASQNIVDEVVDENQFIVSVRCKDETDMGIIYDEMTRRGYECKLIR